MRLLYFYAEFCGADGKPKSFRGIDNIELNFATEMTFLYDKDINTLMHEYRRKPLPKEFWSNDSEETNIYNVNVIAGENGSGKTTVINYLIDTLYYVFNGLVQYSQGDKKGIRFDVSAHRNILLFEDDADKECKFFLVDLYPGAREGIPAQIKVQPTLPDLQIVTYAHMYSHMRRIQNNGCNEFLDKFRKIKIIHMTNMLTQRDYELHIGENNERLRDYFVYDCTTGAAIGPSVAQFFPYEVYKQVKYVFDGQQYAIRKKLEKKLPELIMPRALRLIPRIDDSAFDDYKSVLSNVDLIYKNRKISEATQMSDLELPLQLSVLCVFAYSENLRILTDRSRQIPFSEMQLPRFYGRVSSEVFAAQIEAVRTAYFSGSDFSSRHIGIAKELGVNCKIYIDFLQKEGEELFSLFKEISTEPLTYEMSLEMLEGKDELAKAITEFIRAYRYTCEPTYTIDFDWGLSSGEENMLRLFAGLYHIFKCDYSSGRYGPNKIYNNERSIGNEEIECDSVMIFMDEADLTLHPEWQRRLIYVLTTFIPHIYPNTCVRNIQLLLSTHSPLLLGDIPQENVVYLTSHKMKDEESAPICKMPSETFGQNIHTILKDSFFLNKGTIGEFAAQKINKMAADIRGINNRQGTANQKIQKIKELRQMINLVAPGVLRTKLEQMFLEEENKMGLRQNEDAAHKIDRILAESMRLSKEEQLDLVRRMMWEMEKQ